MVTVCVSPSAGSKHITHPHVRGFPSPPSSLQEMMSSTNLFQEIQTAVLLFNTAYASLLENDLQDNSLKVCVCVKSSFDFY